MCGGDDGWNLFRILLRYQQLVGLREWLERRLHLLPLGNLVLANELIEQTEVVDDLDRFVVVAQVLAHEQIVQRHDVDEVVDLDRTITINNLAIDTSKCHTYLTKELKDELVLHLVHAKHCGNVGELFDQRMQLLLARWW